MLIPIGILLTISTPGCHPVLDGDRILGRHLAQVDPAYSVVPPDTVVGLSPSPGVHRVLPPAVLRKLLDSHGGNTAAVAPICLEWPMRQLTADEIRTAMNTALGNHQLTIEILDFTAAPIPSGAIVFPRSGITSEDSIVANGATWRGEIILAEDRRYRIWARAKITGTSPRIVATRNLTPGQPLAPGDLQLQSVPALPARPGDLMSLDEVSILQPRRAIRKGEMVRQNDFDSPSVVVRGQMIQVNLDRRNVRFQTIGRATMPGRLGDWITIENPESGRKYRGLIKSPGKVEIP